MLPAGRRNMSSILSATAHERYSHCWWGHINDMSLHCLLGVELIMHGPLDPQVIVVVYIVTCHLTQTHNSD
jgi:hypothetical protein